MVDVISLPTARRLSNEVLICGSLTVAERKIIIRMLKKECKEPFFFFLDSRCDFENYFAFAEPTRRASSQRAVSVGGTVRL